MLNLWKCPNCWTEYKIDSKFETVLKAKKDCKFCVRKDPAIPTASELDSLITQDDMRNRSAVMLQCKNCKKWTKHINYFINYKNIHRCNEKEYK